MLTVHYSLVLAPHTLLSGSHGTSTLARVSSGIAPVHHPVALSRHPPRVRGRVGGGVEQLGPVVTPEREKEQFSSSLYTCFYYQDFIVEETYKDRQGNMARASQKSLAPIFALIMNARH